MCGLGGGDEEEAGQRKGLRTHTRCARVEGREDEDGVGSFVVAVADDDLVEVHTYHALASQMFR